MTDDSDNTVDNAGAHAYRLPRIKLARGAAPWVASAAAVSLVTAAATRRSRRWGLAAVPALAGTAAMLWFFRDPERVRGEGHLLAPADGVVQQVDRTEDDRTRVAVFMSPLDVHVNRAPALGVVSSMRHRPGGHHPAFDKDSEHNERMVWHFDTELGDLELVQIAGTMARRIVPYVAVGDKVEQAMRIGLIRFGSRVDVYLPRGIAPAVRVGDRTRAGWTRLDAA